MNNTIKEASGHIDAAFLPHIKGCEVNQACSVDGGQTMQPAAVCMSLHGLVVLFMGEAPTVVFLSPTSLGTDVMCVSMTAVDTTTHIHCMELHWCIGSRGLISRAFRKHERGDDKAEWWCLAPSCVLMWCTGVLSWAMLTCC